MTRNGAQFNRNDAKYIIWNFPSCNSTSLNYTSRLYGSVLAPFANGNKLNKITGNVVFTNVAETEFISLDIDYKPFIGDIPIEICASLSTTTSSSTTSSTTTQIHTVYHKHSQM